MLTTEVVLYNTGKVDMDFTAIEVSRDPQLAPGEISVQPPSVDHSSVCVTWLYPMLCSFAQGHIQALDNVALTVSFLPGVPERFQKTFQVLTQQLWAI